MALRTRPPRPVPSRSVRRRPLMNRRRTLPPQRWTATTSRWQPPAPADHGLRQRTHRLAYQLRRRLTRRLTRPPRTPATVRRVAVRCPSRQSSTVRRSSCCQSCARWRPYRWLSRALWPPSVRGSSPSRTARPSRDRALTLGVSRNRQHRAPPSPRSTRGPRSRELARACAPSESNGTFHGVIP